jgi:hypothetical protein
MPKGDGWYKSLTMEVTFAVDGTKEDEALVQEIIKGIATELAAQLRFHEGAVMLAWPAKPVMVLRKDRTFREA